MKLYFAKYLPVEPDGKRKDMLNHKIRIKKDRRLGKIINTGVDTGMYFTEMDDGERDYDEMYDWDFVKLFLCSRDIQVGDKISFEGDESTINLLHYCEDERHLQRLKKSETPFFSVIGEISSDALSYVKEGDEFDEDEVLFTSVDYVGWRYKIKGPCGHFH